MIFLRFIGLALTESISFILVFVVVYLMIDFSLGYHFLPRKVKMPVYIRMYIKEKIHFLGIKAYSFYYKHFRKKKKSASS